MSEDLWAVDFYDDLMCTIPIGTLHFGQTWAGETKTKVLYMRSKENGDIMNISYTINRDDVKITGPTDLPRETVGKVEVAWSPDKDSIGINTNIEISAVLVS